MGDYLPWALNRLCASAVCYKAPSRVYRSVRPGVGADPVSRVASLRIRCLPLRLQPELSRKIKQMRKASNTVLPSSPGMRSFECWSLLTLDRPSPARSNAALRCLSECASTTPRLGHGAGTGRRHDTSDTGTSAQPHTCHILVAERDLLHATTTSEG